jgi:hypothetical protein
MTMSSYTDDHDCSPVYSLVVSISCLWSRKDDRHAIETLNRYNQPDERGANSSCTYSAYGLLLLDGNDAT